MKKYVITGAPGCGKTTLVNELKAIGYTIIPEVARSLIDIEMRSGGNCLPWIDRDEFQRHILENRIAIEYQIYSNVDSVFLDRGIPDGIAYYIFDGLKPPDDLIVASQNCNYNKIFWLSSLSTYKKDSVRKHSQNEAQQIGKIIFEVYFDYGFNIVKIPDISIPDRLSLLLSNIKHDIS